MNIETMFIWLVAAVMLVFGVYLISVNYYGWLYLGCYAKRGATHRRLSSAASAAAARCWHFRALFDPGHGFP